MIYAHPAGYDTTFRYPFPIIGRNGVDIRDKWTPHPQTYLSVCVDGFPNWFFALGPSSAVGSGSLLALVEQQVEYAVTAAMKMQRERLKSVEVKRKAVGDYGRYIEVTAFCRVLLIWDAEWGVARAELFPEGWCGGDC